MNTEKDKKLIERLKKEGFTVEDNTVHRITQKELQKEGSKVIIRKAKLHQDVSKKWE